MDARLSPIVSHSLIPVVVIDDADSAPGLADALVAGGLPVAEVTFRTPAAAEAIARMATNPDIILGAGTVHTAEQVDRAVEAGATYIVSAGLSTAVVRRAQELGVAVLPGIATATEIVTALDLGLDAVKFFPRRDVRRRPGDQGPRGTLPGPDVRAHRRHRPQEHRRLPGRARDPRLRRLLDVPARRRQGGRLRHHRAPVP